jgi:thiosulfate dehydrogenase [quinone] large subunit
MAVARITLGFVFLWAFLDKLFGLHYATVPAKAWLNGGSPTKGFLMGVHGPLASFFNVMAGQPWADWLFMLGVAGIGGALILGVGMRIAAVTGSLLVLMMWAASLPIKSNPFIDQHIVYITLLWVLFFNISDPALSLAGWWRKTALGRNWWLW